jgi:peptidyl-prolyl cis-trans isomerase B (cyclophilin B)
MANQNPVVTFTMENGDVMKAELYPDVAHRIYAV